VGGADVVAGTGGLAELPPVVFWSTGFSVLVWLPPEGGSVLVPEPPPFVVVDGAPLGEGVDVAGMVVLDVVVPPPEPLLPLQAAVSGASASATVARTTTEYRWIIFASSFLRRKPGGETRAETPDGAIRSMDTLYEANHASAQTLQMAQTAFDPLRNVRRHRGVKTKLGVKRRSRGTGRGDGILGVVGKRAHVVAESARGAAIPAVGGQHRVVGVPDQGCPRRDEPMH
jgi:hypothetical protein